MILSQTWRCTEIKMFVRRRVRVEPMRGALLSVLRWQLKRESVFANLYSYLIWNECHSHSLLVTETEANMEAKWTNRWVVCELLCLQGLSVLLLIRLIMHPESILQLMSDWSWCAHVPVCLVCVCVFTAELLTASYEIRACHGNRPRWKTELCFVKIPFLVKAQAINGNITANEAHFI